MYILERKQMYIPREASLKNRTHQGYRWKQYAMCAERGPLEEIIASAKNPKDWRIVEYVYHISKQRPGSGCGRLGTD